MSLYIMHCANTTHKTSGHLEGWDFLKQKSVWYFCANNRSSPLGEKNKKAINPVSCQSHEGLWRGACSQNTHSLSP